MARAMNRGCPCAEQKCAWSYGLRAEIVRARGMKFCARGCVNGLRLLCCSRGLRSGCEDRGGLEVEVINRSVLGRSG